MYIVFFIILILILLCLTYIEIIFSFHRINEDDQIKIRLKLLFGLIKLDYIIPYLDVILDRRHKPALKLGKYFNKKSKKSIFNLKELDTIQDKMKMFNKFYNKVIKYITSKIKWEYLKWHTVIGLNDAAYTAISVGALWAIKTNILHILIPSSAYGKMDIKITPDYSKYAFQVEFDCIIKIKIANIIIAGVKLILTMFLYKIRKGGGTNERASYSRTDENYNG